MAFDAILQGLSAPANTDLSSNQYAPVIFNGSGKIALAAAGKNIDGILQDAPKSGQAGFVAVSGIAKGLLSGDVSQGAQVQVAAGGSFVTLSSGTAVGKALTGGSSGDVISILLYKSNAVYA